MSIRPEEQNPTNEPIILGDSSPAADVPAETPPAEPVSLVDKATRFEQTRVVDNSEMVSLSALGDTPVLEPTTPKEEPIKSAPTPQRKVPRTKKERQQQKMWRIIKAFGYVIGVLGISLLCTYLIIGGILDVTGMGKSEAVRRVDIAEGATTSDVADALKDSDLIGQKLIFRVYSRLTKADGTYQPGTFYLTANMGYSELIRNLQEVQVRATVTVTIPEGSTVEDVARLLSNNGVCAYADFYETLLNATADTFDDKDTEEVEYPFLKEVPTRKEAGYEDRIYWLEGYLFPDTYEFFQGISAEDAIGKLLGNFHAKLEELQEAIDKSEFTLDEVITLASIVQGEAADTENMPKVARVILNRIDNYAEFPYLQCDSTGDYLERLSPEQVDINSEDSAYDSYTHMGLPPGPINCPGFAAIKAVVNPSTDKKIMKCYYFANDAQRNTYYAETYEEHMANCIEHNIGIHAQY